MKYYIFLTNTIGGYSGGPAYIRNKMSWLKENGWDVNVFDSTGQEFEKVHLEDLKPYMHNRIEELYFNPNFLSTSRKKKVISKICQKVPKAENVVVESNLPILALWGEMIASMLNAKHIVFLIAENLIIKDLRLYNFLKYKSNNKELFSINAKAYKMLFSKFEDVSDEENHWWLADNATPIVDVPNKRLDSLPASDLTISHFGRYKDYFPYMIQEVDNFASQHQNLKINFVFLGSNKIKRKSVSNNLTIIQLGSVSPIPKSFYDKSDVIIAAAGCASMSYNYGAVVISMDVSNNVPLGILGYTTLERTYRSNSNNNEESLSQILDNILIKRKYDGITPQPLLINKNKYDIQVQYAELPLHQYYDVKDIGMEGKVDFKSYVEKLMLKSGLVGLRTLIRHLSYMI